MTSGDRNSKFFHAIIVANRRSIFIDSIKNDSEICLESRDSISNFLIEKFSTFFKAKNTVACHYLGNIIQPVISKYDSDMIGGLLSLHEI